MNVGRSKRAGAAVAGLVRCLIGSALALGVWPSPATADQAGLAVFDAYAASRTVTMQPRAAAVLSLVVEQYVGATHALLDSAPRAQGYAATYGIPLANDARGAGIPVSYGGQCYANYPGEPDVSCGVPIPGVVAPRPPEGSAADGGAFFARAQATGDSADPVKLTSSGVTEGGGTALEGVLRIGFSRSRSHTFIDDTGVHAVTASAAENIDVAEVLHIGKVSAVAETVHSGDLQAATGQAATDITEVTIGGVPVVIGNRGVLVQGNPMSEAKGPDAQAVAEALASQGMTIEPLTPPTVARDDTNGFVEANTNGFRVLLRRPSGDRFDLTFGEATSRTAAVRAGAAGQGDELLLTQGPTAPGRGAGPATWGQPADVSRREGRA